MTRGEVQVLITSLHVIHDSLQSSKAAVPSRVFDELAAMERFLKQEWDENPKASQYVPKAAKPKHV